MPYLPTEPAVMQKPVVSSEEVALNTFRITSVAIDMDPNNASKTSIRCLLQSGVTNQGVFTPLTSENVTMSGEDVLTKMVESSLDGETIYDAVKRGLYELMQGRGLVPEGSIA